MENKDLHHYISHYGDFSPINLNVDIDHSKKEHEFIFASEFHVKKEVIIKKEANTNNKQKFYF